MSSMTLSILLYLTLGLIAAGAMIVVLRAAQGQSVFRARPIMTDNEVDFFRRLAAAWPEGYVFPQVAMSALLKPAGSTSRAHRAAFNRISQKRVDYAIYSSDMELHCVVELDDRSHNAQRDARRDAWLASAGIVTLRFTQKDKPNVPELRERLLKKEPSAPATRTASETRPATVQTRIRPPIANRPATVNTPLAARNDAARPAPAARPAAPATDNGPTTEQIAAKKAAAAAAAKPAPAKAAPADDLEMLEFSPATTPQKR